MNYIKWWCICLIFWYISNLQKCICVFYVILYELLTLFDLSGFYIMNTATSWMKNSNENPVMPAYCLVKQNVYPNIIYITSWCSHKKKLLRELVQHWSMTRTITISCLWILINPYNIEASLSMYLNHSIYKGSFMLLNL